MRMYRKISESEEKVVYEYLWGSYTKPYTGLIEINKKKNSASVLKGADNDKLPKNAGVYALYYLPKKNYPNQLTHPAP